MNKIITTLILLSATTLAFNQSLNPGLISGDQSICYGYAPAYLSFTIAPSGGTIPYSYRWQRSNDNGATWVDITGTSATKITYSPPVLGRTTLFRCRITDASLSFDYTNYVTINISPNLTGGEIGPPQSINPGDSPTVLVETIAPAGGNGTYSYTWLSSSNGLNWSEIEAANSSSYAPAPMFTDTWFRRIISDELCGSTSSNSVKIAVDRITLYTTELPPYSNNDYHYSLGTEFMVLTDGVITSFRLYSHINEGGTHQIRLWRQNELGVFVLDIGPIDWTFSPGIAGWRNYKLPQAIPVLSGVRYIISITNGTGNEWYVQSENEFSPVTQNIYIEYIKGVFHSEVNRVPDLEYAHTSYFRDIVFLPFSPGSVGSSQTICYNTAPSALTQSVAPTGGSGIFNYQWQASPDNINWTNIQGATSSSYSPPALTSSTYFKRLVTSGGISASNTPILITVDSEFALAQLQGTSTIPKNTSTNFSVTITGGTPPYTIESTCNNIALPPIISSNSLINVSSGILVTGTYTYTLTSVTDALGCHPQSLGDNIIITATDGGLGTRTNNALIVVNSNNTIYYPDYTKYIKPYLDWFGVPYETCDISSMVLPELSDYAIVIFGHRNVYSTGYPFANLENAVNAGVGLYSFDPHLFDFECSFNTIGPSPAVTSHQIDIITDPAHYITHYHINDEYNPTNNSVTLQTVNGVPVTITINQSDYSLVGASNLATMNSESLVAPLLQVSNFGNGRIAKWSSYNWMFDEPQVLGPVFGMDDLIWRSIVWAARKPFVLQGLPPMITMRVDDVDGTRAQYMPDLMWLEISNDYGFVPWCGTFTDNVSPNFYNTLRGLVNNRLATATPHAISYDDFIYYNLNNLSNFDAVANINTAWNIYASNSIPVSKYLVPHWYLLCSEAVSELANRGIEFIGTHIPYDPITYPGMWLNCGPYRIDRNGYAGRGTQPVFYSGTVDWFGNEFFVSLTEIQDDGGYEWYPDDGVDIAISRGVRHLRRAINSMALPTLVTHEDRISMTATNWRQILSEITSEISSYFSEYDLEYKSMDDAIQYIRAKENININAIREDNGIVTILYSGNNNMATKCYLFTESANQISFELITLPQINLESGNASVTVNNE